MKILNLYCFKQVKKEYKKFVYKLIWLSECVRVYCIGYFSFFNFYIFNYFLFFFGGYFFKFWSGRRRRKFFLLIFDKFFKGIEMYFFCFVYISNVLFNINVCNVNIVFLLFFIVIIQVKRELASFVVIVSCLLVII